MEITSDFEKKKIAGIKKSRSYHYIWLKNVTKMTKARERETHTGQLTRNSTNMVINGSLDKPETITAHIRNKSK